MKRILLCFLCLLMVLSLPLTASAREALPRIVDQADLLTEAEEQSLLESTETLAERYQMDVVILTVDSLEGKSAQDYADDYYDQQGYGWGETDSGFLFLLSMAEREWYISTYGDALYALTDYGIQASAEAALPDLSAGDYYSGFRAWLEVLPYYLTAFEEGAVVDGYADYSGDYYHGGREETLYYEEEVTPSGLLSMGIGLLAAGITIFAMRASMNTRQRQSGARPYFSAGGFHLRTHRDLFLYSNVRKTPRPKETKPSGGGSSVHRSSSGRRHGGGGGKF